MVFNDELIFIHIGKTGGLSCARYLLRQLRAPVYDCHRHAQLEVLRLGLRGVTALTSVNRHCTLEEALALIEQTNGRRLEDFAKVIAVIRHPYTLELSFYKHLQKPRVRHRRRGQDILELADGDFATFVKESGYHRPGHPQEKFFRIDGQVPEQVELIRFEELAETFPLAVQPYLKKQRWWRRATFPHKNATRYSPTESSLLTPEVKSLIYQKHRFMFDSGLYER
ncbi:MAG TPA: hypothetical protein VIS76_10130 [Pseudomonadales bacterium]